MKRINLKTLPNDWSTVNVLLRALSDGAQAPAMAGGGINFDEMVRRNAVIRILQTLEAGAVYFDLENADHTYLVGVLKMYRWMVATPELEEILRGVIDAEAPPIVALPKTNGAVDPALANVVEATPPA